MLSIKEIKAIFDETPVVGLESKINEFINDERSGVIKIVESAKKRIIKHENEIKSFIGLQINLLLWRRTGGRHVGKTQKSPEFFLHCGFRDRCFLYCFQQCGAERRMGCHCPAGPVMGGGDFRLLDSLHCF